MNKKQIFIIAFLLVSRISYGQYWQQEVSYTIDVTLNDKDHSLDGFEKLVYVNRSPDTLRFIWFHLWPNAYKNDRTAFSDQFLENGSTDFYFSGKGDYPIPLQSTNPSTRHYRNQSKAHHKQGRH